MQPSFNQANFAGFQPPNVHEGSGATAAQQWQFNGFQQGFPANYNYSNFNATQQHQNWPSGNQQQAASAAAAQHQWNNWNYYNNGQAAAQAQPASGENSVSYQRTLEYVQQCQQQSWSANNPQ